MWQGLWHAGDTAVKDRGSETLPSLVPNIRGLWASQAAARLTEPPVLLLLSCLLPEVFKGSSVGLRFA